MLPCDIRQPLPFSEGTFDVVYHSHLLEHLPREQAAAFLRECHRVLAPGGVLRVVVPDLERIAREYLRALEGASTGDPRMKAYHEWMVLELYDQVVRDSTGGAMLPYLQREPLLAEELIYERLGSSGRSLLREIRASRATVEPRAQRRGPLQRLRRLAAAGRERLTALLLGSDYAALRSGRHRADGENHLWMYDRVSLAALLAGAGFADVVQCGAMESRIRNWTQYDLDTDPDGAVYKADSLYMEGIRR